MQKGLKTQTLDPKVKGLVRCNAHAIIWVPWTLTQGSLMPPSPLSCQFSQMTTVP